jgi:hypothetical protein
MPSLLAPQHELAKRHMGFDSMTEYTQGGYIYIGAYIILSRIMLSLDKCYLIYT